MNAKALLTISLLTFPICSFCQKINIDVYIERLQMHWKFRAINDSLTFNDHVLSKDTLNIKILLTDNFGSYTLTMTNRKTGKTEVICYKGNKNKYQIDKVPIFDGEGNIEKYLYEKTYIPSLLANCK